MSVAHAWYVMCDLCGNPAEISTESASHARKLAKTEGGDRRRVAGQMMDLCKPCVGHLTKPKEDS